MPRHATITSFRPGRVATNKIPGSIKIKNTVFESGCPGCGGLLARCTKRRGGRCLKCYKSRHNERKELAIKLYNEGKTYKELSVLLGIKIGSVGTYLNKARIQSRWGSGVWRRDYLRKTLPKACELCGYGRATDLAHIVARKDGGSNEITNILILCPNCHHLFDHKLLTDDEKSWLDGQIVRRQNSEFNRTPA